MANPEIKVKIGSDTSDLDKGLDKAGASLARFAKVGAAAASAVAVAMVALTKQSLAQIDVLAKQARSLGLTTEAFQKMTLVAGEAGVEAGALSSMLGLMQRNIVELSKGTALQVAAFGQLGLSIQDLQGLAPDEQFAKVAEALNGITDPAQKTATAMEVFGRAGRSAINMLEGYNAKAQEAAEFQNRFGIAVTQATSDGIERANDAVGRLSMVMTGLGNRMAGAVAPAIEKTANMLIRFADGLVGAKTTLEDFFGTIENARSTLGEDLFNRLLGNPADIAKVRTELDALARLIPTLADDIGEAQRQMTAMGSQLVTQGLTEAGGAMFNLAQETRAARADFASGAITGQQFADKMQSINERAQEVVTSLGDIDGSPFSGVVTRLAALAGMLEEVRKKGEEARAAIPGDPSTLETVSSGDGSWIGDTWQPDPNAPTTRPGRQSVDSYGSFIDAASGGGSTGGGGTGGGMTGRVQALLDSLQTEREIIADWYEESLETLQMATDAELEAIGGRHAAIERLEEEHQARLLGIKEMGNEWGVSAALQGGEEMLNALGSVNKKALKVAKVFGAARAWVDTLTGAAAELKKGTFGFASAAAVLAKGAAFVASIKGVSDSGGNAGSGGGGSSASTSTAAAAQPTTTFAFTIQNDPMGFGESFARQIIEQLNTTSRNGGNIRAVLA